MLYPFGANKGKEIIGFGFLSLSRCHCGAMTHYSTPVSLEASLAVVLSIWPYLKQSEPKGKLALKLWTQ